MKDWYRTLSYIYIYIYIYYLGSKDAEPPSPLLVKEQPAIISHHLRSQSSLLIFLV